MGTERGSCAGGDAGSPLTLQQKERAEMTSQLQFDLYLMRKDPNPNYLKTYTPKSNATLSGYRFGFDDRIKGKPCAPYSAPNGKVAAAYRSGWNDAE